jgi:glycosyltransferase involved in cell wall biosynthesis
MSGARVPISPLCTVHVLAPGRHGGVENVVAMLAAGQKSSGVHVVAVLPPGEELRHPFLLHLSAMEIPFTTVVVGRRSYLREYRALKTLFARLQPRVVHTHGYHADIVAGIAAKALSIPRVSTVHGFLGVPLRNQIYERLQLLALRKADAVIAVSRPLVERVALSGVSRSKIRCVPNGFAPQRSTVSRIEARTRLNLKRDALVVGWVGRLSPEKGPDVMLEALAAAKAPWHLSMIGDGAQRDSLLAQVGSLGIADRVSWHGAIDGAGTLFRAFDAFVLSSRTEGTPIALLEAMDAEIPIVATTVGGVPDVIGPAHATLVPPERPAAIATALDELFAAPTAARERALMARRRVTTEFGADQWLAAIEKVYEDVWHVTNSHTPPRTSA